MDNFVITIARGYGSGGKYIGTKLAELLNVPLIDRELLHLASQESGINEELFQIWDEKTNHKLLDLHRKGDFMARPIILPENKKFISNDNLFKFQAKVLKTMAEEKSFVVIGRAANYVLKDYKNVVSVSIQAPYEVCVDAIVKSRMIPRAQAEKDVTAIDKYRHKFYEYYTGLDWNDIDNFDLVLNSHRLGREACVTLIKEFLELRTNHIRIE